MIRSLGERVLQSTTYEVGGLLIVVPMYSVFTHSGLGESLSLLIAMSLLVMFWASIHNAAFDRVEWRCLRRVASDRSFRGRVIHIASLEITTTIVSVPLILIMTDLNLIEALVVDVILTVVYTLYGFLFHIVYDYLRPVSLGEVDG